MDIELTEKAIDIDENVSEEEHSAVPDAKNPIRQREDFTSEIYKIEINNMGKFGYGEIKKLLKIKLKLNPSKIKTPNKFGGKNHAFVCFRTDADKEEALKVLDGYNWKGRIFKAKTAKAIVDPMLKKRLENVADTGTLPIIKKTILEATAPLAHIPYAEQIKQKETQCIRQLQAYADGVKRANYELKKTIVKNEKEFNGLPCVWHGFKESPQIDGYRNKNEFAVGKNLAGEKIVGFRLGSYIDGTTEVGAIDKLPHVPERTKLAAKSFETYIQASKYEIFSPEFYTGQFRQLSVRLSETTGEIMLIIGIHTKEILDELAELKQDIINYYTEREGKELNIASIYIEEMNKREIGQHYNRMEHIFGSQYITDSILGLKFRVSAASFFQINTKAAEVLYKFAIDLSKVDENTSVLDICCGTGTIGLCFAKHCKEVLGVEIIEEAIKDAKYNAEENQINNCTFYAGNCDDYIHSLVHQAKNENLLAVIDPPRAGLQARSKDAIRNARGLNRFIYIACSPKAALKNWIDFARPCSKTLKGPPFILKEAGAVDMFPHTDHQEMVLLFERITDEKPKEPELKENSSNLISETISDQQPTEIAQEPSIAL